MRRILVYGAVFGCWVASGNVANACAFTAALDLTDVKYAYAVVVGQISNYERVLDPLARKRHEDWMSNAPEGLKAVLGKNSGFLSDYARFQVTVDEVLYGDPPNAFPVTWDNSTFSEPENIQAGSYLIAVRQPGSKSPRLRGPSATLMPTPEPDKMTVLQAPCAQAFLFPATSEEAQDVRRILRKHKE